MFVFEIPHQVRQQPGLPIILLNYLLLDSVPGPGENLIHIEYRKLPLNVAVRVNINRRRFTP